jgi:hypothetical protein
MSEAIKVPNAKQEFEAAYHKMIEAYDRLRCYPGSDVEIANAYKLCYKTALDNYRDICTIIVERLALYNPMVLEDMTLLWLA